MLFLKGGNKIIGMVGILYLCEGNYNHIAKLFSRYILKEYLGKRLFSLLMVSAIREIKKIGE